MRDVLNKLDELTNALRRGELAAYDHASVQAQDPAKEGEDVLVWGVFAKRSKSPMSTALNRTHFLA
ncbi:MAG TPA: hypothetical protein PK490_11370 [Prosthecobacter sp.]|nr:hypothetical protein [Prosthecobacter sp.]